MLPYDLKGITLIVAERLLPPYLACIVIALVFLSLLGAVLLFILRNRCNNAVFLSLLSLIFSFILATAVICATKTVETGKYTVSIQKEKIYKELGEEEYREYWEDFDAHYKIIDQNGDRYIIEYIEIDKEE